MLVNVTPEPVDSPMPAGLASADGGTNHMPHLTRQAVLEDDLSMKEEVVADLDLCDSVVGGPTSTFLSSADGIVDLETSPLVCHPRPTLLETPPSLCCPCRPCWRRHRWCVVPGRFCIVMHNCDNISF